MLLEIDIYYSWGTIKRIFLRRCTKTRWYFILKVLCNIQHYIKNMTDSLEEESRTKSEMRWEIGGWRLMKQWRWRALYSLAFSPDGSWYRARWFSCLKSSRAPGVNPEPNVDNRNSYCPTKRFHLVFLEQHLENCFSASGKRQNIPKITSGEN